jgi:hypothetical protein
MIRPLRHVAAWFAILGLLLQVALGAAHSARHFDHLVGHLLAGADPVGAQLASDPGSPLPAAPSSADLDHCAIGLCLAASGSFVLPAVGIAPLPPVRETARLKDEPQAIGAASRRHLLPPARAPPVDAISV